VVGIDNPTSTDQDHSHRFAAGGVPAGRSSVGTFRTRDGSRHVYQFNFEQEERGAVVPLDIYQGSVPENQGSMYYRALASRERGIIAAMK
jgi:hypothetical protein